MCSAEDTQREASRAADVLLEDYLGVRIAKALDLSTPRGFDQAVAQLARRLRGITADSDAGAVREALAQLDIDWASVTPQERARAVRESIARAGRALRPGAQAIESELGPAARAVVAAARKDSRQRHRLAIAVDFNAVDHRAIGYLRSSETLVVRDAYGRRLERFSVATRSTVADGLERGLGRADIAAALEQAAEGTLTGRGRFYWETVAAAFTGRGRAYGQLSAFAEAGIDRYRIEAVLDEQTTPTCRFLHGKEFTVRAGLEAFARAEAEPERLKDFSPWVRERVNTESGRRELYVKRGEQRVTLAEELRSGLGRRDDAGEFQSRVAAAELTSMGLGFPPYHGLCRTTCVPA
jgi:SPP1 gp7 family putative phage head morphogenesis protein